MNKHKNNEDYKFMLMSELAKKKSLRDAVKWLNTSISKINKSPADLIINGQAKKALSFLKNK